MLADLRAYWPLVKPGGGVCFGDDYCVEWPGVRAAVDEFAALHELELEILRAQLEIGRMHLLLEHRQLHLVGFGVGMGLGSELGSGLGSASSSIASRTCTLSRASCSRRSIVARCSSRACTCARAKAACCRIASAALRSLRAASRASPSSRSTARASSAWHVHVRVRVHVHAHVHAH